MNGHIHTNSTQPRRSILKPAHKAPLPRAQVKACTALRPRLRRRQNIREMETPDPLTVLATCLAGNLKYRHPLAPTGLPSEAQPAV